MASEQCSDTYTYDAVFLDRDGTLNVKADEGHYISNPADLALLPGVGDAIRTINQISRYVIVVTNQRGVALGRMTLDDVRSVNMRLQDLLNESGALIDAFYVCPHDIGQCHCRKPDIGLLLQANRDFPPIRFSRSVLVGDADSDMEAARRVGMRGIRLHSQSTQPHHPSPWQEVIDNLILPRTHGDHSRR